MRNLNVELVTKEGSLAPINNARLRLKRLGGFFCKNAYYGRKCYCPFDGFGLGLGHMKNASNVRQRLTKMSRELFIKIVLRLCTQNKNSSMNDFNEHPKI